MSSVRQLRAARGKFDNRYCPGMTLIPYRQVQQRYRHALIQLISPLLMIFGVFTILHCLLVSDYRISVLFFSYVSSYTAALICQVSSISFLIESANECQVPSMFHTKPPSSCDHGFGLLYPGIHRWMLASSHSLYSCLPLQLCHRSKPGGNQRSDWDRLVDQTILRVEQYRCAGEGFHRQCYHVTISCHQTHSPVYAHTQQQSPVPRRSMSWSTRRYSLAQATRRCSAISLEPRFCEGCHNHTRSSRVAGDDRSTIPRRHTSTTEPYHRGCTCKGYGIRIDFRLGLENRFAKTISLEDHNARCR